jgi:hypothetical protein
VLNIGITCRTENPSAMAVCGWAGKGDAQWCLREKAVQVSTKMFVTGRLVNGPRQTLNQTFSRNMALAIGRIRIGPMVI